MDAILNWKHCLREAISIVFAASFYYIILNIFYKYFIEKKKVFPFLKTSIIAVIIIFSYQFCMYKILPEQGYKIAGKSLLFFSFFINTLFYVGLGLLIAYLTFLRDEKKQRKILEEQKMELEVEKSQANFNFLKAQINPHFLHNTLNFLYAKSLPYSPELSEGILTLSDIMRYALNEDNSKDGKAPLKDEIEHVRNVIKIQQLRFSNKLNVHFEVEGIINGAAIIPFVLITLVENAFKHGDLKTNEDPIVIKVSVKQNELYFYCRNRKKKGPKELSTGIGLDNIKKRLELAYGKNYSFNVKDDDDFYVAELTINQL
jgi:LytS/YehU family sensor histidine kinase